MAKRRRPQIIFKLLVFLLLGAIINVAVAWGAGAWDDYSTVDPEIALALVHDDLGLEATRTETATTTLVTTSLFFSQRFSELAKTMPPSGGSIGDDPLGLLPSWGNLQTPSPVFMRFRAENPSVSVNEQRWLLATGWPCRSCWCELWQFVRTDEDHYLESRDISGAVETSLPPIVGALKRVMPFYPIWPGFAMNTILYGAILWMVLVLPFNIRRRRRIKRGLCARCAYPVGTNEKCTECGAGVAQ